MRIVTQVATAVQVVFGASIDDVWASWLWVENRV